MTDHKLFSLYDRTTWLSLKHKAEDGTVLDRQELWIVFRKLEKKIRLIDPLEILEETVSLIK